MRKFLWVCLFASVILSGNLISANELQKDYLGLFANVKGVAQDDVLNVRENPTYKSNKVGSFPRDSFMIVDYCKQIGHSTWCKVFPSPLMDQGGKGWVNAHFLKFSNRGYVSIQNRKSICDYALSCKRCENKKGIQKCLVVTDVGSHENIQLKTEWIDREQLKSETNFTAADDPDLNQEGGYCTQDRMIEDYLREHPQSGMTLNEE